MQEYPDYLVKIYTCYNWIDCVSLNKTSLNDRLIPADFQVGVQFYQNFNQINPKDLEMLSQFHLDFKDLSIAYLIQVKC